MEDDEVNAAGIPLKDRCADKLLDNADDVEASGCCGTDDEDSGVGTEDSAIAMGRIVTTCSYGTEVGGRAISRGDVSLL